METPLATLFISARRRLGISQAELAKRCGFKGQSSVTDIERGLGGFRKDKIPQVAKALGVTEEALRDAMLGTKLVRLHIPAENPYVIKIEFTPLEHRRILQLARDLGLTPEQVPNWLRRKVLDWLSGNPK